MDYLSEKELNYLKNQDFLLTKRQLSEKFIHLLGQVQKNLRQAVQDSNFSFPTDCDITTGKISKGENYQGLPYWVLDYPKLFQQDSIFTLRTMLWWGNEWTVTLHLQGKVLKQYQEVLWRNLEQTPKPQRFYLSVGESPWEYHFGKDNYLSLTECLANPQLLDKLKNNDFLKISQRLDLVHTEQISSFTVQCLEEYLGLLG